MEMHTDTFKIEGHEYRVHHDGDWTGGAEIVRPDGTSVRLPAALLRAIGARLFCSRALAAVEEALDGIDREANCGDGPTITYPEQKPPPGNPVQVVRGSVDLYRALQVRAGTRIVSAPPGASMSFDGAPVGVGYVIGPGLLVVRGDVEGTVAVAWAEQATEG